MKTIKKLLSLFLLLCLFVCADHYFIFASVEEEITADESSVVKETNDNIISEYPTADENYISYLYKPGKARNVATSSVQMSQGGVIEYDNILNDEGLKINISLKYILNDGSGDMVDASGDAKWRMVYCLEYKKTFPQGTSTYDGGAALNKYIIYCLTYGVQYWGETSTYSAYSTGDWTKDYAVTQYAIHAFNKEYVRGGSYEQNRDWVLSHITYPDVRAKTEKLINDALNDTNYNGFNGNTYTGYQYFLSPSTQSGWSAYTYNGQAGYITNNWYVQDYRDTIYTSKSKPWYIKYAGCSVSGVNGAQIIWHNSKSWSDFKIWVPKTSFESAQATGATVTVSLTNQIPGYLSAWKYNPESSNNQITTIYEAGNYSPLTSKVTATIAKVTPKTGSILLKKTSSKPDCTNNNDMYSLKDAVYTVYKKGTSIKVGEITTDANGVGKLSDLPVGSYDVKETKAPKGYALDAKVYTVTIDETNNYSVSVDVADVPQSARVSTLLQKTDADTGESSPKGNAVLSGAEFTVKYYDVLNGTNDPSKAGKKPIKTWVFKTNENGIVRLENSFFVSGDALYLNAAGVPVIPLGTIVIQETKAPEGYLLNDEIFVIPVTSDTTSENVTSYIAPAVSENVLKLKLKKMQSGTDRVIEGAIFEHKRPNGEKEVRKTDEKGELSFDGLEWGEHVIKEISAPAGYFLNTNEIAFTVKQDNVILMDSNVTETDINGKITIVVNEKGNIEVTAENKPSAYKIRVIKKNNQELYLEGAEFTLYADQECTSVIERQTTDKDGVITFEKLLSGKCYYLKETKAPVGYTLLENGNVYKIYAESEPVNDMFDFYINDTRFSVNDTDTSKDIYLNGTKEERMIHLTIHNSVGLLLPETGSNRMVLIICLSAVLLTVGFLLFKNKKME